MKNKIVQFIRSTDNLDMIIQTPVFLARAMNKEVRLYLILETRYEFGYHMAFPLTTGLTSLEYADLQEKKRTEAEITIREYLKKNHDRLEGVKVTFEVLTGISENLLHEKSRDEESYMIVICEKEEQANNFITELFNIISKKSGCPVLILPASYQPAPFSSILYATDYNEEDFDTLNNLSEIAASFKAHITALHITDNVDMEERIKGKGFETLAKEKVGYPDISFAIYPYSEIENGIIDFSERSGSDLIVVLKENKGFMDKLLHGSSSRRILKKSNLPLLVFGE